MYYIFIIYIYMYYIFIIYIYVLYFHYLYIYTIYIRIWYIFAHSKAQICIYIYLFIYIYIYIYICIGRDAVCGCFPCTFFSRVPKCFFWNCVYQHKQEVWGRTRSNYTQSQGSSIFLQQGWRIQRGWNLLLQIFNMKHTLEQPQTKKGLKPVSYDLDDELLFERSRFVFQNSRKWLESAKDRRQWRFRQLPYHTIHHRKNLWNWNITCFNPLSLNSTAFFSISISVKIVIEENIPMQLLSSQLLTTAIVFVCPMLDIVTGTEFR